MAENHIDDLPADVTRECARQFDEKRQDMIRAWAYFCAVGHDEAQTEIDGTVKAMQVIAALARNEG